MDAKQIITSVMTDQLAKGVTKKLNIPQSTSKSVVDMAIPLLLSGLAKNSQNPQEAEIISTALSKDHDGKILNDILSSVQNDSTQEDGGKIVDHILGNKQVTASQTIGKQVGIDPNQVLQILSLAAPIVMGAIGKQKKKSGFDNRGLSDFLQNTARKNSKLSLQKSDLLSQLLDQNNDGSVIDDVAKIGMNVLGNLFKKSK